ncbi:MAG: ribonuclease HI [Rickettsiales bacterium]|jgi:ribonuclease HI|nr:ribonuclease HI [Rickettsiales bacterium]
MDKESVVIYSDGACSGNPGKGGWGAVLIYKNNQKEISGCEALTTNNRMELMAAIEALKLLKRYCNVILYTDSQYVKRGVTEWLGGWKNNDWKNSKKEEVKNRDLWQQLDVLIGKHNVEWRWVKGHSGDIHNDRVDYLARQSIKSI